MDPEDYEFYEEWLDRDDDEQDISLKITTRCAVLKNMVMITRTTTMRMMIQIIGIMTKPMKGGAHTIDS